MYNKEKFCFKAVSEIITILILLGITIFAGYFIYRGYLYQAQRQQYSVAIAERIARERIGERFSLVAGYIRIINTTSKEFVLIIYNHGESDLRIWKIYIPAIAEGGHIVYLRFELNRTIPSREIGSIRVQVDDPTLGYAPGTTARVRLYTYTNRMYEFNVPVIKG